MFHKKTSLILITTIIILILGLTIVSATDTNTTTQTQTQIEHTTPQQTQEIQTTDNNKVVKKEVQYKKIENKKTDNKTLKSTQENKTVNNYTELKSAVNEASSTDNPSYSIKLDSGTYTQYDADGRGITWSDGYGFIKNMTINGNHQTIRPNSVSSLIFTVTSKHTLILQNLTISESDMYLKGQGYIINNGTLILDSSNSQIGVDEYLNTQYNTGKVIINNSNITKKIYNNGNITITNTTLNNSIVNNGTLTIINSTIFGTINNTGSITLINTIRDPNSSIDGNGKIIIKNTDNKVNTVLRVNPLNTVFDSNTTTVTGILTTEFNKVIQNAVILVTVNNNTYTNRTNYKGEYSISIPVVYGINNVTVTFNGDNNYNKAVPQNLTVHSLNYTTKDVNVTDWVSLNKTITEAGDVDNINEYHVTLLNGSYHVSYIDSVGQGHYRPLIINWGKGSSPIRTIVINGNNQVFHMGGINISKGYSMKLSNLNIDDGSTEYIPGAIIMGTDKYLLTTEIINQGNLELTSVPLNYTSAEWDSVNNKTVIVNSRVYNLNIANKGNLTLNNYAITNGNPGGTVIFNNCLINGTFGGSGNTLIINDNTVIGTNATLTGNPKIITNKTLNITKFISRTFNGTSTLNNISIENSINYGNLTVRNSVIDNKYGEFVNTGNLTIINSKINSYLINNASGVLTLHNSRLNNTVYNYGTLIIGDDVILGNQTVFAGNGRIITNRTDVINYIQFFDGDYTLSNIIITTSKTNNGNLTLNNCTINNMGYNRFYNNGRLTLNHSVLTQNGVIENKGTLILNHSRVNGTINNNGTLIISDDTVFQSNAVIYNYSNSSIITNKTDILHYMGTYTGNNTFRNVKFTTNKINTGNLTLINSSATYIRNNGGNLTLINSTVNGIGSYYGNIIIINSTISHITGNAVYNLTIINTTVSGNKFKGNGSCIDIRYSNNEKYTNHQSNINIINSKFTNNTSTNNKAVGNDIHLDGNSNMNVIIRNTTFIGSGSESGVYVYSNKKTVMDNCTVINKTSRAFYTRNNFNGGIIGLDGSQKVLINNTLFKDNKGYAITTAPYRIPDLNITNNNFINTKYAVSSYIILAGNYDKMSRNNKVLVKNNTFVNTGNINARVRYLTVINNTFINSTAGSSNAYTDLVGGLFYCNNSAVLVNNTYINCNISFREFRINNVGNVSVNDTVNITASIILENPDQYDKDILNKTEYEFYVNNKLYSTTDTPNTTIKITGRIMTIKVKADFTSREATLKIGQEQNLTVIITPGNMRNYLVDGELQGIIEEAKVYFRGNFTNINEISIITPNIIINGANASFTNTSFSLDNNNITITGMYINNTDTSEYTITSNGVDNNITGNTIITYNHAGKTAAIVNNAYDNNIITGNNINVYGPALSITYTYMNTVANTQGILSLGGDNNIIRNNKIRVYNSTNPDSDAYSTIEGITAPGSSNHVIIENNNIYVTGGRFNYGIDSLGSINNTIIKDNKINVTGHRYVDGIQLGNQASNCIITGNNLTLNCFNTTGFTADNEALAFGIIVTNMGGSITSNITVANNKLEYNAPISYGMEIYQTSNVTVVNNTFNGNGYYTMGLSLAHSPNAKIINNTMNLHGNSNIEINYIVEEVRPANTGIQVQQDSNNITIDGNKITVDDIGNNDRAINLDTQKTTLRNINITNNKLETRTQTGNNAIKAANINNLILRNNTGIKTNTTITINPITNTPYSDNITITGTLKDNNNGIREANITITLNNKTYITKTNNNGTYTLKITAQKIGTNKITAKYNGNNKYKTSNTTRTFNVTKINTNIKTSKITAKLGTTTTITATIKDANGNNITNGRVAIKINGKTFGYSNITNGKIRFNINLSPENFGKYNYKVLFTYGGSNTHEETRQNTTLTITAFNPVFNVKITNATSVGNTAVMTVKVSNGTGYNARSGTVGFKINGKTYKVNGKAYTLKLKNGTATFKFNITKDMTGTKSITITYSGNSQFNQNRTTISNALTIKSKVTTTITSVKAVIGENAVLTVRFIGADGQRLTSGKVAIKINGKTFGHANIKNGTVTYTLKLDPKKFSARNYTVTFKYGGSSIYTEAVANTTLIIVKHTSKFSYTTTTARRNTTTRIILKITDNKNTINANNGTVGIKFNGKTYKVNGKAYTVKPVNGTATFTVNTNNLKTNNNITFTYSGYREFTGLKQTYNNGLRIRT